MQSEGPREPETLVERAASDATDTAERVLEASGAKALRVLVVIAAEDVPDGERNATVTGVGYDDQLDLLTELLSHARSCAKAIGIQLEIAPLGFG